MNLGLLCPSNHFDSMVIPACEYTKGKEGPCGNTKFPIINLSALGAFIASCQLQVQSSSWEPTFPLSHLSHTFIVCLLKCSTCWKSPKEVNHHAILLWLGFWGCRGRVNDSVVTLGLHTPPMATSLDIAELPFLDKTSLIRLINKVVTLLTLCSSEGEKWINWGTLPSTHGFII